MVGWVGALGTVLPQEAKALILFLTCRWDVCRMFKKSRTLRSPGFLIDQDYMPPVRGVSGLHGGIVVPLRLLLENGSVWCQVSFPSREHRCLEWVSASGLSWGLLPSHEWNASGIQWPVRLITGWSSLLSFPPFPGKGLVHSSKRSYVIGLESQHEWCLADIAGGQVNWSPVGVFQAHWCILWVNSLFPF